MRLFEFLAAYFRTGGGRVVGPAPADVVPLDTLLDDAPPRRVCVHPELGGPCRDGCAPADVDAESAAVLARDELDEHYADARAVVDAGRTAVDQYDADRAGAATDVRPLVLAPEIAPAPPADTGVNVDLLLRTLEHITEHPGPWDQDHWWIPSDCGSTGCMAGWAVQLSREPGEHIQLPDSVWGDGRTAVVDAHGDRVGTIPDVAEERLGLTFRQRQQLFNAGNSLRDLWTLAARFTDGAIVPPAKLPDGS